MRNCSKDTRCATKIYILDLAIRKCDCYTEGLALRLCAHSASYGSKRRVTYVEIKCQLDATEVFIADLIA